MPTPYAFLGDVLVLATLAGSWGACFIAWYVAFQFLPAHGRPTNRARGLIAVAGLVAGVGVWAQPSLACAWPDCAGFDPTVTAMILAGAIFTAAWGLAVERFFSDARGTVGGGAILGGGIALSNGALLLALRAPAQIGFDDVMLALAVAVASALAVGGLITLRRRPGRFGQMTAVVCLTAATVLSHAITHAALVLQPGEAAGFDPAAIPRPEMTLIAGAVAVAVTAGVALFARRPGVRRATRVPA